MAAKKHQEKKSAKKTASSKSAKAPVSAKASRGKSTKPGKSAPSVKKKTTTEATPKATTKKQVTKTAKPAKATKVKTGQSAKSSEKTVTKATKATKAKAAPKTEKKPAAAKSAKSTKTAKAAEPAKAPKAVTPKVEKTVAPPKASKAAKTAKAGKATKGTATAAVSSESTRVTVKIGGGRPVLSIAPGVMINRRPEVETASADKDATKARKLTKKEISEIRTMLEEKREQLLYGIRKELQNSRQRSVNASADPMDKATDSSDDDLSFEIASASDEELSDIQVALKKIDDGTYGECEGCGCDISISRLRVLPFAIHCRDCRNLKEQISRREDTAFGTFIGDNDEEGTEEE